MLSLITAVSYLGAVGNGRTRPVRLEAIDEAGQYVETVTKFSAGCDRGVTNLAVEAICASLAVDLGLPVPEPYLVQVDRDIIDEIPDSELQNLILASEPLGFGSKQLPPGFFTWALNTPIHADMIFDALGVYVFDCFIQNIDRKPKNPNCLTNGTKIGIFDHEISLNTKGVLFWKAPWETGGLDDFASPDKHIFYNGLCGSSNAAIHLHAVAERWQAISAKRIEEYGRAIPPGWQRGNEVQDMLNYLNDLISNLDNAMAKVRRVLS